MSTNGYIKSEHKSRPARRRDKVKLWLVEHADVVAVVGVGTLTLVGGYFLIKADMAAQAKAREAEAKLIEAINRAVEVEKQVMPLYPVPPAS